MSRVPRELRLSLTEVARTAVEELLATGLFGLSAEDVVTRILHERLRALALEGWLPMPGRARRAR